MEYVAFDAGKPDLDLLRQVIFRRLRDQSDWRTIDTDPAEAFKKYLHLAPPRHDDQQILENCVLEVFWQLAIEGIIAPGSGNQGGFPWFRVTQYGRIVLREHEYVPHDRGGYLQLLHQRISQPDATVVAYLAESLDTFSRGSLVSSTLTVGVAAERVFDLLCESLAASLSSSREQKQLADLRARRSLMKQVDWVHAKLRAIQDHRPRYDAFPENTAVMVTAIYDMIRLQRNELGHPREQPPQQRRGDVQANLLIFPRYYETAENVRLFLKANKV